MPLNFKYNSHIPFQLNAINSIVNMFNGHKSRIEFNNNDEIDISASNDKSIFGNHLHLTPEVFLRNLQRLQKLNHIPVNSEIDYENNENLPKFDKIGQKFQNLQKFNKNSTQQYLNLTIEMETGTGKTYVYLRTIYELYHKFGLLKFIIVVPSVAIREGVLHSFYSMHAHFSQLYGSTPMKMINIDRKSIEQIRLYARASNPMILLLTRDSFNKDINLIYQIRDQTAGSLINYIQMVKPIVILDEPHKMGGKRAKWGIDQLNPLIKLRFSATHSQIFNLVYRFDPYDAFIKGFVKKIDVLSLSNDETPYSKKIGLETINVTKSKIYSARIRFYGLTPEDQVIICTKNVKIGMDLEQISNNSYYHGFILSNISLSPNPHVEFTNKVKIYLDTEEKYNQIISRKMIHETIKMHLIKKRELTAHNVKVLSLFFIPHVKDYLIQNSIGGKVQFQKNGYIAQMFEQEYEKLTQLTEFSAFQISLEQIANIHDGYFAVNKGSGKSKSQFEQSTFSLIMRQKERLLSFSEPLEFIFSHSALREGWDNPNIFNICTLGESFSQIKKRQEIGRGMRLAVDQSGNRILSKSLNRLTLITNETYYNFAKQLQQEYDDDLIRKQSIPIESAFDYITLRKNNEIIHKDFFKGLYERLKLQYGYKIHLDSNLLINACVSDINKLIQLRMNTKENYYSCPDLLLCINNLGKELSITKNTLFKIFEESKLSLRNCQSLPLVYEEIRDIIKKHQNRLICQKIEYYTHQNTTQFQDFPKSISNYSKYLIEVQGHKSLYIRDFASKLSSNVISMPFNPSPKKLQYYQKLINQWGQDDLIELILVVPEWYTIPTPFGDYHPDWIIIKKIINSSISSKYQYFLFGNKNHKNDPNSSRFDDQIIKCVQSCLSICKNFIFFKL